ncbi:MAG: hypothetical protein ACYDEX_08125 [Mobilitalea sp.]
MVDAKEKQVLKVLDKKYQNFMEKSLVDKGVSKIKDEVTKRIPSKVKDGIKLGVDNIQESELWKKVFEMAADGFTVLQGLAVKNVWNRYLL